MTTRRRTRPAEPKRSREQTLMSHAESLLDAMLGNHAAQETTLRSWFRAHPRLGARDRAWIADAVHGCLRHLRSIDFTLQRAGIQPPLAWQRLLAWWVLEARVPPARLRAEGLAPEAVRLAQRLLDASDPPSLPDAVRAELPDWLFDDLAARLGTAGAIRLAEALGEAAPLDLRVNSLRAKRDRARQRLAEEGIETRPTAYSPFGLRTESGAPVERSASFRDGWVEIQDEGSQLLSLLVEPRRQDLVVDLCAGAGGKTLHLGALMGNRGQVYAFDISARRLDRLRPRLQRASVRTVRAAHIEGPSARALRALRGKADRVLVDVPCSGTGTLRRHPELRWQHHDFARLRKTQAQLLTAAVDLLRPGGRLVYATCSLLRNENEARVEALLADRRDLALLPVSQVLARRRVPLEPDDDYLRLDPYRHGCDGFFAAIMIKTGDGD